MQNPKVYTAQGPRREIKISTNGDDDLFDHGIVFIQSPDGWNNIAHVKSITLELESQ